MQCMSSNALFFQGMVLGAVVFFIILCAVAEPLLKQKEPEDETE